MSSSEIREYILDQFNCYWGNQKKYLSELKTVEIALAEHEAVPPQMVIVDLPLWGAKWGVDGQLLIPEYLSGDGKWQNVDWILSIFWYMNGLAEIELEKQHGPTHSYSYRLKCWDSKIWDHAWCNRIALFLREWAAHEQNVEADDLFGHLPEANITLTHDVDAVSKTLVIRFKQTVFYCFNCLQNLKTKKYINGFKSIVKALRFLVSCDNYWQFEKIIELENKYGVKSHFNFFAGDVSLCRSFKKKIFDPGYDINRPKLKNIINRLNERSWIIGLHTSFDSCQDENDIRREKEKLELVLGSTVKSCRQHWLRFSWAKTWKAQQRAGLELDTTLGFNDRPGFRNGTALSFRPWDFVQNESMKLKALPNVLMDSQFYDYHEYTDEERDNEINKWVNEVKFVHGEAAIIWHQRVFSNDYNWGSSYTKLNEYL